jgi:F420-dependent oxidoreductase-like protein
VSVTRFGLQIPSFTYPDVPDSALFDRIAAIAKTAEDSGFDSVWVMDHFYQLPGIGPEDDLMLEAYTLLGGLAARTSKAKLGTMVTGVTYRNPAMLAKIVTTLDLVSSGRAILGLGAAWNESEHRGNGFEFPPTGERMDRLEEALQIAKAMFTESPANFTGKHYQIDNAHNVPRPVTAGGPPIMIGGSGEKRTLRMVAKYGDASNVFGDVEGVKHKLSVIEKWCEVEGRDPAEITNTKLGMLVIAPTAEAAEKKVAALQERMGGTMDEARLQQLRAMVVAGGPEQVQEQVQAYFDAGLDGILFNMPDAYDLETVALAGETLAALDK